MIARTAVLLLAVALVAMSAPLADTDEVYNPEVHFGAPNGRRRTATWGYEGEVGPAHWGDLDPSFATCKTGTQQSPINLPEAGLTTNEGELEIDWHYMAKPNHIANNGHTVQVDVAGHPTGPTQKVTFHGKEYFFLQFHIHQSSENHVDEHHYPAEIHCVHKAADNSLLVVGMFVDDSEEEFADEFFAPFWGKMPSEVSVKTVKVGIDLPGLLDLTSVESYWTFAGSLTTPPCTEGVTWIVLEDPVEIGVRRLRQLRELIPFNARITMPINGRI